VNKQVQVKEEIKKDQFLGQTQTLWLILLLITLI